MALNFPDSPTLNQIYRDPTSGFSYQWNGSVWISYVASGTIADGTITPPKLSTGKPVWNSAGGLVISGVATASSYSGNLANTLTLNTSGTGLSGSTTFNNSGASTFTVASNATNLNLGNTVVSRDGSGNFSAGTVSASSFSGNLANTLTLNTSGTGLSGSTTFDNSGISTFTVTSNATSSNTGSTIVARDGSGNFSAGTVTATTLSATAISAGGGTGTSGQVLQSTGAGVTWADAASGGLSVNDSNLIGYNSAGIRSDSWNPASNGRLEVFGTGNFQVFTSPGTYVVNPGITSIRVRVVGAGGNGGSGGTGSLNPNPSYIASGGQGGGGGGGGGYAHKIITSFSAPRTYTVTVGSAPGGTSSFGSEVSATGGSNGTNGLVGRLFGEYTWPTPSAGGAGGTGSGGDVNYTGATGVTGQSPTLGPPSPGTHQVYTGGVGGSGGASATQKGNGSGSAVPGLTGNPILLSQSLDPSLSSAIRTIIIPGSENYNTLKRFPFDIFTGYSALTYTTSPIALLYVQPSSTPEPSWKNGGTGGYGYSVPTAAMVGFPTPTIPIFSPGGNGGDGGGGGGGNGSLTDVAGTGGLGGFGAGGGAGGGTAGGNFGAPTPPPGGSGGSGGSGIVIVEW